MADNSNGQCKQGVNVFHMTGSDGLLIRAEQHNNYDEGVLKPVFV